MRRRTCFTNCNYIVLQKDAHNFSTNFNIFNPFLTNYVMSFLSDKQGEILERVMGRLSGIVNSF